MLQSSHNMLPRNGSTDQIYESPNDRLPSKINVDQGQTINPKINQGHNAINLPDRGLWSWIPHVQQPDDDASIINSVKDVLEFAESFINTFYRDGSHDKSKGSRSLSTEFHSSAMSINISQEQLKNARYQTTLIKYVLISRLLSLISFDDPIEGESLLPREYQSYFNIAMARSNDTSDDSDIEILHLEPALSAYRVLSVYLRPNISNDHNFLADQQPLMEKVSVEFEDTFRHWAKPERSREERKIRFHELLDLTRNLGVRIFSHPARYLFDWDTASEAHTPDSIPIWPRLLKIFDIHGRQMPMADLMIPMRFDKLYDLLSPERSTPRKRLDETTNPSLTLVAKLVKDDQHDRSAKDSGAMKALPALPTDVNESSTAETDTITARAKPSSIDGLCQVENYSKQRDKAALAHETDHLSDQLSNEHVRHVVTSLQDSKSRGLIGPRASPTYQQVTYDHNANIPRVKIGVKTETRQPQVSVIQNPNAYHSQPDAQKYNNRQLYSNTQTSSPIPGSTARRKPVQTITAMQQPPVLQQPETDKERKPHTNNGTPPSEIDRTRPSTTQQAPDPQLQHSSKPLPTRYRQRRQSQPMLNNNADQVS